MCIFLSPRDDNASLIGDDDADDDDAGDLSFSRMGKTKKRPGRKPHWSDTLLNDMIDIIVNDEYFRKKLIFTNTKNQKNSEIYSKLLLQLQKRCSERNDSCPYSAPQLRTKFKKCVAECKKAAMTMKTASGIARFQEERGYGIWFSSLFALVKTRDSCQPDQAIEPSADNSSDNSLPSTSGSQELFVPIPSKKRKTSKEKQFSELIGLMKDLVEKDPMKEFLEYAKEEAEKTRQHEITLMKMLTSAGQANQNSTIQPNHQMTAQQNNAFIHANRNVGDDYGYATYYQL